MLPLDLHATFVKHYVSEKVDYWVSCVQKLSVIAKVQPHVAYCAFTHGLVGTFCKLYLVFLTFFNPKNLFLLLLANVSVT